VGISIPNYTKHGKLMSCSYNVLLTHNESEPSGFWDITKSFFLSIVWLTSFDSQKLITSQLVRSFLFSNLEWLIWKPFWNSNPALKTSVHYGLCIYSARRKRKKRTGIAIGYNCFGKRIILVFLGGE
jgi:hypothetical protein